MDEPELSVGDLELLDAGRFDDISLDWALVHLRIVDDFAVPTRPSASQLDRAFHALQRLIDAGLVRVGHLEYVDHGPAGRVAPVELVPLPLSDLRAEVDEAVASTSEDTDWAFTCWSVNTDAGDARAAVERPES